MSAQAPAHGGFAADQLLDVLDRACRAADLDPGGARLIRGHTNAVFLLAGDPVVVKIARRGTPVEAVRRTVEFVTWLKERSFPTVPLHPVPDQPMAIDQHPVTFWTYLPQPTTPITAAQIAAPLHALHHLPTSPVLLPPLDHLTAIRTSLATTTTLPEDDLTFLSERADRLEHNLTTVTYPLAPGILQGDPQHRNTLLLEGRAVLCDWDTICWGQPEWDLTTIEIHCRRFHHGPQYHDFAHAYGHDITNDPAYPILRDLRELRMITTNARKTALAPHTLHEIHHRIDTLRHEDTTTPWHIL